MAIIKNGISNVNVSTSSKFQTATSFVKSYLGDWRLDVTLLVLLLASAGSTVYFYSQYNDIKVNPQKIVQDERAALLVQVSRLIFLPTGEDPTIATVSNVDVLRNQLFFANAKNGDRVLIYANARKAILYDPVSDKIVEVAPVNIGNPTPPSPSSPKK